MASSRKVAVITGASSGIGKATARRFAEENFDLLLIGRDHSILSKLSTDFSTRFGVRANPLVGDLLFPEKVAKQIRVEIEREFERVDVLVNNAGIIQSGTIEDTSYEDFRSMMKVNVDSLFLITQALIPYLEKTRGSIVNVSSVAGLRSFPGIFAYGVSKAAVDQITRISALELAPKGIRVNAVNPGVVRTQLHRRSGMSEDRYQAFLEHSKSTHPLGRVGEPEEVADLIFFLASENAGWITGNTVSIDGGRFLTCLR